MTASTPEATAILSALEYLAEHGVGTTGSASLWDVGTTEFVDHFDLEILGGIVAGGGATCRVYDGLYGVGKSHTLDLLHRRALCRGMLVARIDLSQALSLENWKSIVQHILRSLEGSLDGETVRSLPKIVDLYGNARRLHSSRLEGVHLPHNGFARAMALIAGRSQSLTPDARQLLRAYLLGEAVGATALRSAGLRGVKGTLSAKNAEHVLISVLSSIHLMGLPGTLLLFDENEKSFEMSVTQISPPRRIRIAANLLRRLIDACSSGRVVGTAAIFAVLPTFLENCRLAYPALGQRLGRPDQPASSLGWRWPVLPILALSTIVEPKQFLEELIRQFEALISSCGCASSTVQGRMRSEGLQIINDPRSREQRRRLVKHLAAVACQHIAAAS
jgi:hypothetical protein